MSISKALLQNSEQPNPTRCLLWKADIQQNITSIFVHLRFLTFAHLNISIFFPENVLYAHDKQKRTNAVGKIWGEKLKERPIATCYKCFPRAKAKRSR